MGHLIVELMHEFDSLQIIIQFLSSLQFISSLYVLFNTTIICSLFTGLDDNGL